jgi:GNAT superfamily N-acetyltransferase
MHRHLHDTGMQTSPSHFADDPRFDIRHMNMSDVDRALDWAAAEGWNPGLHDAAAFYAADPDGFFVGTWHGEPVACISAVAYGAALGFIGLYIVQPAWRGKGLGIALWKAAMDYLGERNIGLDGVLAQQANYRQSGFALAYRHVRYEGVARVEDVTADIDLIDARSVPFDLLLAYDTHHFCAARALFLRAWIAQDDTHAIVAMNGDIVRGMGVIRRCRSGLKIGPLFADDIAVARTLYRALSRTAPGETVFLDVPESNPAAVALAVEHEMTSAFETARMYTRAAPAMPLANVFGVTTFELG